jgi:hypothetical protein
LQLCGIIAGVNALAIFFFFPETQYSRKYITGVKQDSSEGKDSSTQSSTEEIQTPSATSPPKKTFLQELSPLPTINPDSSYFHLFIRSWPLILYPAVFFSFLIFATTLAWLVCVVNTYASIFQAPPFLMSTGVSGLINLPAFIGTLAGSYCGGGLTDLFAERWARKNNGVFEPETRLVALIIPFFLVPVGLLMYALRIGSPLTIGTDAECNIKLHGRFLSLDMGSLRLACHLFPRL